MAADLRCRRGDGRMTEALPSFLEVSGLVKIFGGVTAVDHLDFTAEKGRITAIIGPNGAGKTTLFHLISGFIPPTSGEVRFEGRLVSGLKPHRAAHMGMARTFQNVQIFSTMTVLENVMAGRHTRSTGGLLSSLFLPPVCRPQERIIRETAMEWLAFTGLADHARQNAAGLPLGRQRMLEIARALAAEPRLLLLDEPASGLNARETLEMGRLIGKIRDMGIGILLVEHDMELVMEISDQVVVINFGTCIARGAPAEIQVHPDVLAAYLGDQRLIPQNAG